MHVQDIHVVYAVYAVYTCIYTYLYICMIGMYSARNVHGQASQCAATAPSKAEMPFSAVYEQTGDKAMLTEFANVSHHQQHNSSLARLSCLVSLSCMTLHRLQKSMGYREDIIQIDFGHSASDNVKYVTANLQGSELFSMQTCSCQYANMQLPLASCINREDRQQLQGCSVIADFV